MILQSTQAQAALLRRSRSVAVVGASANPERPSHGVFAHLRAHGYDATPINPALAQIDGVTTYASLQAFAAEHGAPDIVDVFRKSSEVLAVTQSAIDIGAKAIWFQLGVRNDDAIALADSAGLDVVVDRCMKIEDQRMRSHNSR